jgi:DNA-binding CsgD family transcriptional regulator
VLVGRETECARIDRLLADASAGASGAVVLTGEPGIGKSALCAWAAARVDGMRVLSARGVASEADLPFAGLAELCAGELDRLGSLPEPQARALDGALARRVVRPGDRFAIGAAVLSLLAVAGDGEPVLVVVDDAQWLDASSADALLFAARRLRSEGVAMLIATLPGTAFDAERNGLSCVTLGGLDASAAQTLLEAAHGALPAHVARLLADRSEGNPLALLEVPRLLSRAQLAGQQPIDEPLPTGPTLERALLQRVSGLPAKTRRGLLVAAASSGELVQPVIDAVGVLELDRSVFDAAEHAGVLAIGGERLQFRHPLLRSAIYHAASGPARRAAHGALARATSGEPRAWHLAQATVGVDEAVAAMLEDAGLEARRRGAPAAAAAALERAARLSPASGARVRRLTGAARDAYLAGRPAFALELLDEALSATRDPHARADAQHLRGRILLLQGHANAAYQLLADEAQRVRDIEPGRATVMLAEAALDCISGGEIRTAVAVAQEARDLARAADPAAAACAVSVLASALALNGKRRDAAALLDRCVPLLGAADPLGEASELVANAAQSCSWVERGDLAAQLLDRLITSARAASAPTTLPYSLAFRAELNLRTGRWALAAAQAQEAVELAHEMGQDAVAAMALCFLARITAAAGDEQRCRDIVARGLSLVDEYGVELGRAYLDSALGLLELGLGRTEPAIRHLESVEDFAEQRALAEPNIVHWQADLIEAYIRAGKADAAQHRLAAFERQALETGGRWALGTAARCRGLLADNNESDARFAASIEQLQALPAPFEIARTYLCQGERLRRAGRRIDARHFLSLASERFDQLGATPWTKRAHRELRATGATARRRGHDVDRDQLTAHELQVALTVAGGASNREAAAALFLSPKTIEFHLARIYRKLGVRTRTELAALAATRGWLHGGAAPMSARRGDPEVDSGTAGLAKVGTSGER